MAYNFYIMDYHGKMLFYRGLCNSYVCDGMIDKQQTQKYIILGNWRYPSTPAAPLISKLCGSFPGPHSRFPTVKFKGGNLKIDVVVAEHGKTWIVPETYDVCDLFRIKSSADFVWDVYA